MGTQGNIQIHVGGTPSEPLNALRKAIESHKPTLVIIDPLSRFLRVTDFNSYDEVSRVTEPLIDLARETDTHILVLHHNGKGEREGSDSLLGSTAFFGAVDTLLIMKRRDGVRSI